MRIAAIIALACVVLLVGALALFQRKLMYFPGAQAVPPTQQGVEAVRIRTPDGETLVAWRHAAAPGEPTFLFFDGNAGRPEDNGERWARIMERGAGFLALYYRGYSGSTGRPSERGLHADARAGYDWLVAQGVRPGDIIIHGLSLGSGVAVRLAAERPARALILEAPFTAAVDVARLRYSWLPVGLIMQDQFRSRDWIGRVRIPVLIVHGDADQVVPIAQGQRLYALANEPKAFVRMPGSGHNTLVYDGLYDHVWRFLDAHALPREGERAG
jgi:fermentation-respiration switch protein FrsA (DUF1100 family)